MEYKIFRCRKEEFSSIVPRQPYRPELKPNEVRLEFEAVLLDINEDQKNQLWIHAKIKACVSKKDCDAVSNFTNVSLLGVELLLCDCTFIPADWGSQ